MWSFDKVGEFILTQWLALTAVTILCVPGGFALRCWWDRRKAKRAWKNGEPFAILAIFALLPLFSGCAQMWDYTTNLGGAFIGHRSVLKVPVPTPAPVPLPDTLWADGPDGTYQTLATMLEKAALTYASAKYLGTPEEAQEALVAYTPVKTALIQALKAHVAGNATTVNASTTKAFLPFLDLMPFQKIRQAPAPVPKAEAKPQTLAPPVTDTVTGILSSVYKPGAAELFLYRPPPIKSEATDNSTVIMVPLKLTPVPAPVWPPGLPHAKVPAREN